MKVVNSSTPKQAVKKARTKGVVRRQDRIKIENKAKNKQVKADGANKATAGTLQNSAGSESTKVITDDDKR